MKHSYIQLTDAGKRELMRQLTYELTDKKIAELMDQFADGVKLDSNGEPYIKIDANEVMICVCPMHTHYIDINHIETVTANEEDGSDE
jgi:hypothetical protein